MQKKSQVEQLHGRRLERHIPRRQSNNSTRYIEAGLPELEDFVKEHGDYGKMELNNTAHTHKITITADDTGNINSCGCDLQAGVLRILFKEDQYGSWQRDGLAYLVRMLSSKYSTYLPGNRTKRSTWPRRLQASIAFSHAPL